MLSMTPLALVAAAPLTNTACDPVPTPICSRSAGNWVEYIGVNASWSEDAGEHIILLDLQSYDPGSLHLPTSYTVVGGTLLPFTTGKPEELRIKPDAGVTSILVEGALDCEGKSGPFGVTVELAPPDGGGSDGGLTAEITQR
jgi:hypothetical protein